MKLLIKPREWESNCEHGPRWLHYVNAFFNTVWLMTTWAAHILTEDWRQLGPHTDWLMTNDNLGHTHIDWWQRGSHSLTDWPMASGSTFTDRWQHGLHWLITTLFTLTKWWQRGSHSLMTTLLTLTKWWQHGVHTHWTQCPHSLNDLNVVHTH